MKLLLDENLPVKLVHSFSNAVQDFLRTTALILTLILVSACSHKENPPIELRIMSYNIAAGYGSIEGIANVIETHNPDIVALQEVDVHWGERSDFKDQVRFLEERLNMNAFFGEIYSFDSETKNDPPREFGLAFLSKPSIIFEQNHPLSRLTTQETETELRLMPGFPEIAIEVVGTRIHVFNTHLDYRQDPSARITQIGEMIEIMESVDDPLMLAGDLNARPSADELQPLFDLLMDPWKDSEDQPGHTFPSDQPDRRIDYILHSRHFQVSKAFTAETPASDHLPVVVDLLFPQNHHE